MARDEKLTNKSFWETSGITRDPNGKKKDNEYSILNIDGAEEQATPNQNVFDTLKKYISEFTSNIGDKLENTSSESEGYMKAILTCTTNTQVKTTQSSVARSINYISKNTVNNMYLTPLQLEKAAFGYLQRQEGRRNFSTNYNSDQKLKDLISKSEALDKKLSIMIAEELKKQLVEEPNQRT